MVRKTNTLDASTKYKLGKSLEAFLASDNRRFDSWDKAASFFSHQMNTTITKHNLAGALAAIESNPDKLIKSSQPLTFLENVYNAIEGLKSQIEVLSTRIEAIERELK